MAGLDVNEFLETTDETVRARLHGIAKSAGILRRHELDYLARAIVNELGKAMES